MRPEEKQAIRERYYNATCGYLESSIIESMDDVPRLLAEVESLEELVTRQSQALLNAEREIARLKRELADARSVLHQYVYDFNIC
ncbi:hypothetical protein [Alicyclobacillus macrosporangiidus]|uniref:Uncharacterized protein n=1 Tax=Alicyclobacillus macrosporangiidus TaxID=392015 RepID=A0A1I7FT63_9BACL|nr:hypothetical protein [Alicyclobacillus macrosporangiidus]SFU39409.1 hypothetical protein SAMN05421543_101443 [Alicyclobacillus macrosporangiidus]